MRPGWCPQTKFSERIWGWQWERVGVKEDNKLLWVCSNSGINCLELFQGNLLTEPYTIWNWVFVLTISTTKQRLIYQFVWSETVVFPPCKSSLNIKFGTLSWSSLLFNTNLLFCSAWAVTTMSVFSAIKCNWACEVFPK